MSAALLAGRLLLAVVLLVAGLAKLADLTGSRRAVSDFGFPTRPAAVLGTVLPFVELTAGLLLIPTATARFGALAALGLLLSFAAAIAAALARGVEPDCHCFGQLHSAPAGRWTLMRDLALSGVAAFVVVAGWSSAGGSATAWIGGLDATQAVGLAAGLAIVAGLCFLGWFSLQLLRQNGRLLARIEALEARAGVAAVPMGGNGRAAQGLPVGSPAPEFSLSDLHGDVHDLESILSPGRPAMLVFSDPRCGPCTALLPELGEWELEHAGKLSVVIISQADEGENVARAEEHGLGNLLLERDREVSERYEAYGTPSAVLVDARGTIASSVAGGADAIRGLLQDVMGSDAVLPLELHREDMSAREPSAIRVGEPAPDLALPGLDGRLVSLSDFRGRQMLLLFWDPDCGFCQQLLDDLKAWEARAGADTTGLILISSGDVDSNRAQGLASPILLDGGGEAMRAFGADGTPMGLLIDSAGNVASPIATGADEVLELAPVRVAGDVGRTG